MSHEQNAFGQILIGSIMAVVVGAILIVIGFFTFATVSNAASDIVTPAAATGTLTFSGNVTQNSTVNFTIGTAVYSFGFNFSGHTNGLPTGYNYVNITNGENGSTTLSQNLTARINQNTTLAALLTASNGTNSTIITYDTTGVTGNNVGTTEDNTNMSWSAATLTGGVRGNAVYDAALTNAQSNVSAAILMLGIILVLGGVGGIISVLSGFMGSTGSLGRKT